MSKERLEAIRHYYREMESFDPGTQSDINWLIAQAERAQELESELNKQIEIGYKFEGEVYDLAKENKRYREALKNIYELAEYDEYDNTLEQIVSEVEQALDGDS